MKRPATWVQVIDVDGCLWDVRDARATKYEFDLLFGFPVGAPLGGDNYKGGPPRLIATKELVDYWEKNRTSVEGVTFDLPAGRTTMKRLRRRLGFHSLKDRKAFWRARLRDLKNLPAREFAERHKVSIDLVNHWRFKLAGRTAREPDWWHEPEALAVLRATDLTLREKGEKLGISTSQVHRLQARALDFEMNSGSQGRKADSATAGS